MASGCRGHLSSLVVLVEGMRDMFLSFSSHWLQLISRWGVVWLTSPCFWTLLTATVPQLEEFKVCPLGGVRDVVPHLLPPPHPVLTYLSLSMLSILFKQPTWQPLLWCHPESHQNIQNLFLSPISDTASSQEFHPICIPKEKWRLVLSWHLFVQLPEFSIFSHAVSPHMGRGPHSFIPPKKYWCKLWDIKKC